MNIPTAFAVLCACASATAALDETPQPSPHIGGEMFHDLRLLGGVASMVDSGSAGGYSAETGLALGPRVAVQYVGGKAGPSLGAALGVELAFDAHRGYVERIGGNQTGFGTGDTRLNALTIGLLPRLVLRPDWDDPIDWGPGTVQVEIGPVLAAGVGWAYLGGSPRSDPGPVVVYGVRADAIFTMHAGWQVGWSLGWEGFEARPRWNGLSGGAMSGSGIQAGLLLGCRL